MRSLLLILLLVGSAHGGILGPISNLLNNVGNTIQTVTNQIGQTASNLWNGATNHVNNVIGNVVDSAGNIYGQLVDTANGIQFASNFLWDNIFGPAYDLFVEGGQLFLDDKFGNIVSAIGRRSVLPKTILSEKYTELTGRFKTQLHDLYNGLFEMESEAIDALQKGEKNIEDKIRAFYNRMDEVHKKINQLAAEAKQELETYAVTVPGEWVQILHQYTQNIDSLVATMSEMFQQLVQSLIKNFVQAALTVVPNALAIIENLKQQGLLSFLQQ
ncbi:unnamed protein product [Rotaria socialis]|uniref:Uncharacterized protein n=1 Tax=Rotaria socialis TaxID=392032 RepID=A0A817TXW2_9BILA|nr:unnamed protein product [Rotaria socialis]CAF4882042.1 unnamed protein product [Rotaria socialis]